MVVQVDQPIRDFVTLLFPEFSGIIELPLFQVAG